MPVPKDIVEEKAIGSINFQAIRRILSQHAPENESQILSVYGRKIQGAEDIQGVETEYPLAGDNLLLDDTFPTLCSRKESSVRKPFMIDISSIDSTMNYTVPKEFNGAYDINKFSPSDNHQRTAEMVLQKVRGINLPISVEQGTNALVHEQGCDRISQFQHDIEECEQPIMNEGLLFKELVPEGCKENFSKSGNQILQGEKHPHSNGQYSEATAPASPSHVAMNVKDDLKNDMNLFQNDDSSNADQAKEISWASEDKETVHKLSKELQSSSQNSTGKATCSLVLEDDLDVGVVNSPTPGLRLFDMVQSYLKDQCQDNLNSLQSSRIESSSIVPLQTPAVEATDMYMLEAIHKNFSGQKLDMHSPDCTKIVAAKSDQPAEVFQQKATKARTLSTGPTKSSNITAAITLLRKRKSDSFAIAQTAYEPFTRDIWEGTTNICTQLTSPTANSFSSSTNVKQGVDNCQERSRSSNIPESPAHEKTKCMKDISDLHLNSSSFPLEQHATDNKATRQSKKNTTMHQFQECEKSGSSLNGDLKERTKKKLNCKDWQRLEGAGTLWKGGVRRSTRIRSRPLEFWRGERFLYGRIHDCLSTVIGIKYLSPESTACRKDGTEKFKVQSYVDETYADIVEFAALH